MGAKATQVKNINQAVILEKVDDLSVLAVALEGSQDRLMFPPLRKTDDGPAIRAALVAILSGDAVAIQDLGKLLYYVADVLDDVDNYC